MPEKEKVAKFLQYKDPTRTRPVTIEIPGTEIEPLIVQRRELGCTNFALLDEDKIVIKEIDE